MGPKLGWLTGSWRAAGCDVNTNLRGCGDARPGVRQNSFFRWLHSGELPIREAFSTRLFKWLWQGFSARWFRIMRKHVMNVPPFVSNLKLTHSMMDPRGLVLNMVSYQRIGIVYSSLELNYYYESRFCRPKSAI